MQSTFIHTEVGEIYSVSLGCLWVRSWTWCWYRWKSVASSGRLSRVRIELHTHLNGASARACYDGYWGLKSSWTLEFWGIFSVGSLSHLQQGRPRPPQLLPQGHSRSHRPAKSFSGAHLSLPGFFKDNHLSYLKTATHQTCIQESFQRSVPSISLMNLTGFTTNSLSCPPQTYQSLTIPSDQSLQKEWK